MLRELQTGEIVHPLLGGTRLDEKFQKVIKLQDFIRQFYTTQLGTKYFCMEYPNARHTRFTHVIGVKILTERMIEICYKKFGKYFTITQREKETLALAALLHDPGHIAFSHSLEDENRSHEVRTIEILEKNAEEINAIFGYDIVSMVIKIFKDTISIREQGYHFEMEDDISILFVLRSLLIGSIDCDRMEFIMSDKFNIFGEKTDYQEIFNYITIALIENKPTVGFEIGALVLVENFLLDRFDLYKYIYYHTVATLLEIVLRKYKEIRGWTREEKENISESEIEAELIQILRDEKQKGTQKYRIADVIINGNRKNILLKVFEEKQDYEYFLKKVRKATKRRDIIRTIEKHTELYNKQKNKIYIQDKDGVFKDIFEVSKKLRALENLSIDLYYVLVDVDDVYDIDSEEVKNLEKLFEDNAVEIEKKFIFPESKKSIKPSKDKAEKDFQYLKDNLMNVLKRIPGVEEVGNWEETLNEDFYYEGVKNTAIRYRKNQNSYAIKTLVDDGTCINKRNEEKILGCNFKEFLELSREYLVKQGSLEEGQELLLEKGIKITTKRLKKSIKVHEDSQIEISCDYSCYEYAGRKEYGTMVEFELRGKDSNELSLWYITKYLKKHGFIETKESKEQKGKKALQL